MLQKSRNAKSIETVLDMCLLKQKTRGVKKSKKSRKPKKVFCIGGRVTSPTLKKRKRVEREKQHGWKKKTGKNGWKGLETKTPR